MNTTVITALVDVPLRDLGCNRLPRGNSIRVGAYLAENSRDLLLARSTGKVRVKADDEPKVVRPASEIRVPFPTPTEQPIPKILVPPTPVAAELLQVLIGQIQSLAVTVQELKQEVHDLKVQPRETIRSMPHMEPEEVFIPTIGKTGVTAEIAPAAEHLAGGSVEEASNTLRTTRKKRGTGNG